LRIVDGWRRYTYSAFHIPLAISYAGQEIWHEPDDSSSNQCSCENFSDDSTISFRHVHLLFAFLYEFEDKEEDEDEEAYHAISNGQDVGTYAYVCDEERCEEGHSDEYEECHDESFDGEFSPKRFSQSFFLDDDNQHSQ